ncbi:MAG: efp, partial [Dehalococcoidia bacterium]|nr:efp [Dehalococcoidia bacterium]
MANMVSMSEISRGMILEIEGSLWTILEYQGFKAGKGNSEARMRMKLRDIRTGNTRDIVYRTDDKVARADVENRSAQYTYNDGDLYHFMDLETYDEKIISGVTLGETAKYLVDGMQVELLLHGESPLSLQLPVTVDLKIVRTDPGYKGDTASAATKKAVTHTGLTI